MSDEIKQVVGLNSASAEIGELAAALAVAQGRYKAAVKDSLNPHFKSRYADLASVTDAIREALVSVSIAPIQRLTSKQASVTCQTILAHKSGQWIADEFTVPVLKPDAQGFVAAATYARRASLSAMAGVAPEDDDGNEASGKPASRQWNAAEEFPQEKKAPKASAPRPSFDELVASVDKQAAAEARAYVGSALEGQQPARKSGILFPMGKEKGKDLVDVSVKSLEWLVKAMGESIDDPAKARWRDSNVKMRNAAEEELARRDGDG